MKFNGAATLLTVSIFCFVLGATAMNLVNFYFINPRIITTHSESVGLGNYNEIIQTRGDKILITSHGPILISFIDPNSLSVPDIDPVLIPPGGGSPKSVSSDPPPIL